MRHLTALLVLLPALSLADPMHDFERCMDALGNVENLPPNFPAGEFCAEFTERRIDWEKFERHVERAAEAARKSADAL